MIGEHQRRFVPNGPSSFAPAIQAVLVQLAEAHDYPRISPRSRMRLDAVRRALRGTRLLECGDQSPHSQAAVDVSSSITVTFVVRRT